MTPDTFYEILAIVFCIILSSLYSGSETALTSLRDAKLHNLIQDGPIGSRLLILWRDKPNVVLSSILLGNNLVNILASSLATDLSIRTLGAFMDATTSAAIGVSVGVMTLLVLIFGEVLPKTFAKHHPQTVTYVLPFLLVSFYISWPFAKALSLLTRRLVRLGGGSLRPQGPSVTEEEIEYMIQRSTEEGSLDADKEQMLSGVFELDETMAREIMVPRTEIIAFDATVSLEKLLQTLDEHPFSRYPVFQETIDNVIGIFYTRDLIRYLQSDNRKDFNLRRFVRPPYFVPRTKKLDQLLAEFRAEKIHIAIVVDEYGGTAGIVTLEDVIEEMVGEIYDEYDRQENLFVPQDDGSFIVRAKLSINDLSEHLDMDLPEDGEFDSVGGLVMDLADKVPTRGEIVTWTIPGEEGEQKNLEFEVTESNQVRVRTVRLKIT